MNLYNVNGELVFTATKRLNRGVNSGNISVDNLTKGVYFLKVDGKTINTQKQIIFKL